MKLKMHIKIPETKGLITKKKISKNTYVYYEYDRIYDAKKKITYPQRVSIGKLDDKGLLIPNSNFKRYFPKEELPGEQGRSSISSCLRVGTCFLIQKLINDYDFRNKLSNMFNSRDCGLILDLASYSLISEDNAAQYYPMYTFNHPVFTVGLKRYSDSTISSFLSSITFEQIAEFLNTWNKDRAHKDKIYISYDSTNKNCQSGDLEIVEYGKAKDDLRLPIFNYSIAYNQTNEEPLFYEEYPGSVVDVSQLKYMLEKASGYGYRNVGFILDRGYFSKANIELMDQKGYDFVMIVKGRGNLVSELVSSEQGTFEKDRNCFIREYKTFAKTIKSKLYSTDTKERYFHIFYSIDREWREHATIDDRIEKLTRYLEKQENKEVIIPDIIKHYFNLTYDTTGKIFLGAKERVEVINKELSLCGYCVIVTSEKMTAKEAIALYKGRDSTEKLFRGDKSYLGNQSIRVCSDEAASSKIFIEFIALIIRNKIYNYLRNAKLKNEKKANYMTVPAAIRELEKIEMIRQGDGKYILDHAITATQKEILNAFGLDDQFIIEQAGKLSLEIMRIEQEAISNDEAKN